MSGNFAVEEMKEEILEKVHEMQEQAQDLEKEQEQARMDERAEAKFLLMLEGRKIPSSLRAPEHPPPWLDKEV